MEPAASAAAASAAPSLLPAASRRVVLLRDAEGAEECVAAASAAGWTAVCVPVLRTVEAAAASPDLDLAAAAATSTGIVVTSKRAATVLRDAIASWRAGAGAPGASAAPPPALAVWTLGAACGAVLAGDVAAGSVVLQAAGAGSAAELLPALVAACGGGGAPAAARRSLWLLVGDKPLDTLPAGLAAAGIPARSIQVYATAPVPPHALGAALADAGVPDGAVLWCCSPSGVDAVVASPAWAAHPRCIAIGATTAARLRAVGVEPAAVCDRPTAAGFQAALAALP